MARPFWISPALAFWISTGLTLLALLLYGMLMIPLLRSVVSSADSWTLALLAPPFVLGAWMGTRSGLRDLRPRSAALAACTGALAPVLVLLVVLLVDSDLRTTRGELLGVALFPLLGATLGVGLAVRSYLPIRIRINRREARVRRAPAVVIRLRRSPSNGRN